VREVPLVPQLATVLREHKRHSGFTEAGDYVFATRTGSPLLHRNAARLAFTRAVADSGLAQAGGRRLRFHDLRHTFASHLIVDIRLDVAQVSRILGHARTSITLDTYTHLFEQSAHNADVRAQLARSSFATMLAGTFASDGTEWNSDARAVVQRPARPRRVGTHPAHACQAPPLAVSETSRDRSSLSPAHLGSRAGSVDPFDGYRRARNSSSRR
jgi:hypothetical protein